MNHLPSPKANDSLPDKLSQEIDEALDQLLKKKSHRKTVEPVTRTANDDILLSSNITSHDIDAALSDITKCKKAKVICDQSKLESEKLEFQESETVKNILDLPTEYTYKIISAQRLPSTSFSSLNFEAEILYDLKDATGISTFVKLYEEKTKETLRACKNKVSKSENCNWLYRKSFRCQHDTHG